MEFHEESHERIEECGLTGGSFFYTPKINCNIIQTQRNRSCSWTISYFEKTEIATKKATKTGGRTNIMYKIKCMNCDKCHTSQTGDEVANRMCEHKLITRRYDQLPFMSVHKDQEGHQFILDNVEILGQTTTGHAIDSVTCCSLNNSVI